MWKIDILCFLTLYRQEKVFGAIFVRGRCNYNRLTMLFEEHKYKFPSTFLTPDREVTK